MAVCEDENGGCQLSERTREAVLFAAKAAYGFPHKEKATKSLVPFSACKADCGVSPWTTRV